MNIYLKYFIISVVIIFLDVAWIALNTSTYSKAILKVQKSEESFPYSN